MENRFFIFLIPLMLVLFLIGLQTSCGNAKKSYTMKNYKIGDDYDAEWKQVQAFEQKGLTQDAKNVVEQIFAKAEKEKNAGQTIKALLHLYRYDSYTEEQSEQKVVNDLKSKIEAAEYPVKPVLQSILAQAYWQYFNSNRYQILQRTALANDAKAPDFETWDATRFSREMTDLYMASLADTKKLKTTNINVYDVLITSRNASDDITPSAVLRPTLYDLLAHRALDYFTNDQANITKASDQFEMNQTVAFADSKTFATATFTNNDPLSTPYYALLIFQQLADLHLNRSNPAPLIDAEIKRLKFVKQKSVLDNKNDLYLEALNKMYEKHKAASPSANISYEIAVYHNELGNNYQNDENETFKYDKKKAFEICEAAINKFPDSRGAKNCKRLRSEIVAKNISFQNEENVQPNVESQVLFTYKNVTKVYGKVILLTESLEEKTKKKNRKEIAKLYASQAAVKSFEYELPDEKLFLENKAELPIPALELGKYVVLIATSPEFNIQENALIYQQFQVTNLSFLSKTADAKTRVYARHRFSGAALPNIKYQVLETKYDYKKREYNTKLIKDGLTDKEGKFEITKINNNNVQIVLQDGKDICKDNLYVYSHRNGQGRNDKMTFFFTDRSIYRPGQTLFFKGLMLEKEGDTEKYELLPNEATTVILYDVNGQKVSEQEFKTNEYGTFSGKFTLPNGVLNGQMRIANENGSQYFSLEEYKRPKFEVTFEPIKGSYKLGETVSVEGLAKAYAGNTISDAKVTYRVVREAKFPYWCWWWRPMPSSPALEIKQGTTTTDDNGNFSIDFQALADKTVDKKNSPQYTYTVYADVTDMNGETRSKTTSVSVSYTALLASIDIEDIIDTKTKTTFPIATTNLNGEFEAADIDVSITALKTPNKVFRHRLWQKPDKFVLEKNDFDKRFANDEYDAENNLENWEKGEQVFSKKIKTTKNSKLEIANLNTWKAGKYLVELKTKDKFGEAVRWQKYITVYEQDSDKVPSNELFWYNLSTKTADVGEYVDIFYGSAAEDAKILVEIIHNKSILKREWLSASATQKKLSFKIEEKHRGNIGVSWTMIKYNRFFNQSETITVPWTNKELNIELSTFRNKLLPGQDEEWQLKISGSKGEKVAAEMLAAMYDASLDAFRSHDWRFGIYRNYAYPQGAFGQSSTSGFGTNNSYLAANSWNDYYDYIYQPYDDLNLFGFSLTSYGYGRQYQMMEYSMESAPSPSPRRGGLAKSMQRTMAKEAAPAMMAADEAEMEMDGVALNDSGGMSPPPNAEGKTEGKFDDVQIRKNLQETAFFMPDLRTNADGEIIISFTAPEALTKWRFMALAHTKDLKYKQIEESVVTQKDLMVMPNAPRFLRENDDITISTKVSNLSENSLNGTAILQIFDATSMKAVDADFGNTKAEQSFSVAAAKSSALNWKLHIPDNVPAVVYRIIAKAGKFSDGEENMLPVLTNRMLVTETMPLPVRGKGEHKFTFENLDKAEASNTLKHQSITLEFSSHPVWYAIQALPYMMEYPHECSEQIFSCYYANSIAAHAANSSPKIKKVFDIWVAEAEALAQNTDKAAVKSALLSNLEKNQELKSLLLEETPWVRAAKNESERKQRLGLLFDMQKMSNELAVAEKKLLERQMGSGAWPWFSGMRENRYITQHLVTGIGHLQQLGIKSDNYEMENAMTKAVQYLDSKIYEDYSNLKKYKVDLSKNNLSNIAIHYLYARSFFPDVNFNNTHKKAFEYYLGQAQEYWLSQSKYSQGMIALAVHRLEKDDRNTPSDILESLRQNATYNDEMGMYFKDIRSGWFWYEAPIETQALIIEAFSEISNDKETVDELKIWLLKQKQTQDWKTTKATAEACYALLLQGTDLLQNDEVAKVQLGNHVVHPSTMPDLKTEAGTGYYKTAWQADDIETEMKNILVTKTDDGVAWGAVYWQYFEQLDKITHAETPLAIKKELFLKKNTKNGEILEALSDGAKINVGDLVRVRVEIRVDRLMEYVHLKDMRAAGFEPTNVLSRYNYQDGLGYYESTKDAATNFFMGYLPKGTYVFEYDLRASHAGDFSNGITTMQCMYAPEFTTHSEGIRVVIE